MNNILFLDFDGVLNNFYSIHGTFLEERHEQIKQQIFNPKKGLDKSKTVLYDFVSQSLFLDIDKIQILNDIIKLTGCDIVITSTWRFIDYHVESLIVRGFEYPDSIIGCTNRYNSHRGLQIKEWIDSNNFMYDYLIVDDDTSDIYPYLPHDNVLTVKGLNNYYKNQIIDKLRKEDIYES